MKAGGDIWYIPDAIEERLKQFCIEKAKEEAQRLALYHGAPVAVLAAIAFWFLWMDRRAE